MKRSKNQKNVTKEKPVLFSQHFNIDKKRLKELGIFNPILNFDTKLFMEPLLLKNSKSEIIRDSLKTYKKFFHDLFKLLRISKVEGDMAWRAAKKRVFFPEYKSTCIGYGSDSIHGAGSGKEINDKILKSSKEIVDLAANDPEIFLLISLLEEGIGPDLISDMTQHIIDEDICKYTVDAMKKLELIGTYEYETKSRNKYKLLFNSYSKCPIKLVPRDVLSELPMAEGFDNWLVNAAYNADLRDKVSDLIGEAWMEASKSEKKEALLYQLRTNKDFFLDVLKAMRESSFEHYDLEKDYQGLYKWLENSEELLKMESFKIAKPKEETLNALGLVVEEIVSNFQKLIEKNDLWKMFWTEHKGKHRHVREHYSQMLFLMMAKSWLSSQDMGIKIERVNNKEVKQIEFNFVLNEKFTITILVKHSNNPSLEDGYEKLTKLGTKGIRGLYVVMNFSELKEKQLELILKNPHPYSKVMQIDVAHRDEMQGNFDFDVSEFDIKDIGTIEFENLPLVDDEYTDEKRRGGLNSYGKYKSLRDKVKELCEAEINKKKYKSANQLSMVVAKIVEENHQELLKDFEPYKKQLDDGHDWIKPTFYGWCGDVFKKL
jgi:hypothetical protein